MDPVPADQSLIPSRTDSINPSNSTCHQPNHHPDTVPKHQLDDLANQVSLLNAKLVSSFERISNLEDELHESIQKNRALEAMNSALQLESAQHKEALNGGLLVERANVQNELQRLTQRVLLESEKRSQSEASLSSINQELDDLSASLFSEANRLVAAERLQRIKAERKVMDVEEAMKQVEEVIEARRDQLNHLRLSLESAERQRDEYKAQVDYLKSSIIIPDTPTGQPNPTSSVDSLTKSSSTASIVNSADSVCTPQIIQLPPSTHETITISHLACSFPPSPAPQSAAASSQPPSQIKLSHEILPFNEFTQFIAYLRRTRTELLTRPSQPPSLSESYYSAAAAMTSIASTAAMAGITAQSSLAATSNQSSKGSLPATCAKDLLAPALPLSQHVSQPFVKRCLEEDSEPALRLDIAPGLNFISRRVILTALLEGHLVIEPVWSDHGSEYEKCTLCGCSLDPWLPPRASSAMNGPASNHPTNTSTPGATMRKMLRGGSWGFGTLNRTKRTSTLTALNTHTPKSAHPSSSMPPSSGQVTPHQDDADALYVHTFRAADSASTRYPICPTYCLARLRSVCDFWRFLQSIQLGLLLDETFRFMRYINQPSPGIRSAEKHSLGSAYDNALKRMRGKGKSLDSANYSPILTHSIPSSSISSLAATFRPQAITEAAPDTGPAPTGAHHSDQDLSTQFPVGETVSSQLPTDQPLSQNTIQPTLAESEAVDQVPGQPVQPSVANPSPDTQAPSEQQTGSEAVQHQSDIPDAGAEQPHTPIIASKAEGSCNTPTPGLSPAPPPIPRRSPARARQAQSISSLPLTIDTNPRPDDSTEQNANSPTIEITHTQVPQTNPSSDLPASSKPIDEEIAKPAEPLNKTARPAASSRAEFVHGIDTRTHSRNQSQSGAADLEAGWEERCWQQVVKLKEEMFMKRTGITVGVIT